MRISARADYAVRACLELAIASDAGEPIKADVLAQRQSIPIKFLENILTELRRGGIVRSQRGAVGGYRLAGPPSGINIADIIRVVDGPLAHIRGERPDDVEEGGAAQHLPALWVALRAAIRSVLETTTLEDLATGNLPEAVAQLVQDPEAWVKH